MTAMDVWMLICILFVASATLEYAILLAIKFVVQSLDQQKKEKQCCKIDRYAMVIFIGAYAVTLGTYFYVVVSYKT